MILKAFRRINWKQWQACIFLRIKRKFWSCNWNVADVQCRKTLADNAFVWLWAERHKTALCHCVRYPLLWFLPIYAGIYSHAKNTSFGNFNKPSIFSESGRQNLLFSKMRVLFAQIRVSNCLMQWFSTGVPRKTSVPWKIVRCSAGNLISLTSVPSNTGRKSLV